MLQSRLMKIARNSNPRAKRQRPDRAVKGSAELNRVRIRKRIADEVKLYIEDKNISRHQFEKMVKRSESTMNHFFAGKFADSLLVRIEHVLNRRFGQSYTEEGTTKFVGSFLTLRNDFKNPTQICAYVTTIEWGDIEYAFTFDGQLVRKPNVEGYGLTFREERRVDTKFTHRGQVWFPGGQYLYLVTAYGEGRLRAAIVSVPDNDKMTGIQLSQYNPKGPAYVPAAAPIVLIRRDKISDDELGYILPNNQLYKDYKKILVGAMDDVVMALPTP
jgi:predicted XRE-type DNA-binding protein